MDLSLAFLINQRLNFRFKGRNFVLNFIVGNLNISCYPSGTGFRMLCDLFLILENIYTFQVVEIRRFHSITPSLPHRHLKPGGGVGWGCRNSHLRRSGMLIGILFLKKTNVGVARASFDPLNRNRFDH